jgi:hypothetical protein
MHRTTHPDDAHRAWEQGNALGHFRVLSEEDALTPTRAFTHMHGGDDHDEHLNTRDNARSVNPDDVRMVNASHALPPPLPRRTHDTPGSYSSPGAPWHTGSAPPSHQLTKCLDDVMLTPTRNNRLLDHVEVRNHDAACQTLAGVEDSSGQINTSSTQPRVPVKDCVATIEIEIKRLNRKTNDGPEVSPRNR